MLKYIRLSFPRRNHPIGCVSKESKPHWNHSERVVAVAEVVAERSYYLLLNKSKNELVLVKTEIGCLSERQ
jgi:hypothetical protein